MNVKKWVLWLLVVTFLASELLLFSALHQRSVLQASVEAAQQKVEALQTQVEQLKNAGVEAQGAEVARLRAENQSLPRLRNQVTQLQSANQKLTQQLKATSTYAQQQKAELQQLAAENQQARAIIQQSDVAANHDACITNLRQIDAAKQQWALEKGKPAEAIPTAQDLLPFLKDQTFPVCPSGGSYAINAVSEVPSCTISGHELQ